MSETQPIEPPRRRMQLVAEQQLPDQPAPPIIQTPELPTAVTHELLSRRAWREGVIGGLNVAAMVLGARLILLLSVIGAFTLGWRAVDGGQPMQLAAVGLYTLTVVLPITWLSARR